MSENNILGVVLSGGKSKRFGEDKSKVILGDKTLLEHTLVKVQSKLNEVAVVSNEVNIKNLINIKDCIDGNLGPLVGVLSAMKWVKKKRFTLPDYTTHTYRRCPHASPLLMARRETTTSCPTRGAA